MAAGTDTAPDLRSHGDIGGGSDRARLLVCRHPKPVGINLIDRLRVTPPAETILAAARDVGVLDLVVMADSRTGTGGGP